MKRRRRKQNNSSWFDASYHDAPGLNIFPTKPAKKTIPDKIKPLTA
jgi:hypothetical protein